MLQVKKKRTCSRPQASRLCPSPSPRSASVARQPVHSGWLFGLVGRDRRRVRRTWEHGLMSQGFDGSFFLSLEPMLTMVISQCQDHRSIACALRSGLLKTELKEKQPQGKKNNHKTSLEDTIWQHISTVKQPDFLHRITETVQAKPPEKAEKFPQIFHCPLRRFTHEFRLQPQASSTLMPWFQTLPVAPAPRHRHPPQQLPPTSFHSDTRPSKSFSCQLSTPTRHSLGQSPASDPGHHR